MPVFERTTLDNGLRVLTAPMPQVAVGDLLRHARRRLALRDARRRTASRTSPSTCSSRERSGGRPRATSACEIDAIGGEFNAFTGKEYTGYYVKCAAEHRDIALDVLVDMLRHSKFEPEEIEREKGVIVEEMNMYFDTPRDYIGGVYERAPLRRPAARLGHHRPQGDRARRDARDVPRLPRPLVQAVAHGRRHRRPARRRPAREDRASCSATSSRRDAGEPPPLQPLPNGSGPRVKLHTKAVRPGAPRPRRAEQAARRIPTATPCRCSRRCSAAACRRASSPRCASGAASPTTSTASTTATPTRARSTRRPASTSTGSTRR